MPSMKGGDKLAAALKAIADRLKKAQTVEVGWPEGETNTEGVSMGLIAAINEFGAPSRNQPPRPFFRSMIKEKSPEWPDAMAKILKANDYDARSTLEHVGEMVAGQLNESINNFTSPPLKPSTIKKKGFDKPLVDTGQMQSGVKVVVK